MDASWQLNLINAIDAFHTKYSLLIYFCVLIFNLFIIFALLDAKFNSPKYNLKAFLCSPKLIVFISLLWVINFFIPNKEVMYLDLKKSLEQNIPLDKSEQNVLNIVNNELRTIELQKSKWQHEPNLKDES